MQKDISLHFSQFAFIRVCPIRVSLIGAFFLQCFTKQPAGLQKILFFLLWVHGLTASSQSIQKDKGFVSSRYLELPVTAVKPKGWLLNQLQIMRDGTTGHLDEVHDKVKNDNGWLGGRGDGWEETPYWLDGALPLAYLLNDETLKQKVLRYINWTIDNQRPSGYFGPITRWERQTGRKITADSCRYGEDWWPKMIMLKVLQ